MDDCHCGHGVGQHVRVDWSCGTCACRMFGRPVTTPPPICGVSAQAGFRGEPLACAFRPGHHGAHAWASFPTFITEAEATP